MLDVYLGFANGELDVLQPVLYYKRRQWIDSLTASFLYVAYGVITTKSTGKVTHIEQLKGKNVSNPEEQFPDIKITLVCTVRLKNNKKNHNYKKILHSEPTRILVVSL